MILVVDDDDHLREVVRYALAREGFEVGEAANGEEALFAVRTEVVEAMVLDVNMPLLDGFSVCRRLRESSDVPILFLSSRGDEVDRVLGLDLGGDDYVTKPFSPRELCSRVRALLRRRMPRPEARPREIVTDTLRLRPEQHRAFVGQTELELTATEFRLLAALVEHCGDVLSRSELAAASYPDRRRVSERTVDSHVRRVRAKLRPLGVDAIQTVHGVGFRMRSPA